MKEKIITFINIVKKLNRTFDELIVLNADKKKVLLDQYKIDDLIPYISKENFISGTLKKIQKDFEEFFNKNPELSGKNNNITSVLNKILDYEDLRDELSELKTVLDNNIREYNELKILNNSILKAEASFYTHLFNKLNKNKNYTNKNRPALNMFNTVA